MRTAIAHIAAIARITIALILGIGLGFGATALLQTKPTNADTPCSKPTANAESHQVMIMGSKVDNPQISAKLCDTITYEVAVKIPGQLKRIIVS